MYYYILFVIVWFCTFIQDSTAVAIPTFVAGIFGGPIGAVFGAFFGSTVLGISKACGYGHYKPLMVALKEDFSETERNDLYERTWKKLESFVTSPLTQNVVFIALHELVRAADVNPKLVDSVRDEINRTLNLKKMVLG